VSDLSASYAFWSSILAKVGYEESDRWDDGFTLKSGHDAYLTFVQRMDRYSAHTYHRCGVGLNHLAFQVNDRKMLDSLRQFCIENKINCLYDDKYPFANGGTEYHALFVEDPDRIKVEFVIV